MFRHGLVEELLPPRQPSPPAVLLILEGTGAPRLRACPPIEHLGQCCWQPPCPSARRAAGVGSVGRQTASEHAQTILVPSLVVQCFLQPLN